MRNVGSFINKRISLPARWTGDGLVGLVHGENASTIPLLSPSGKAHPCAIMNII
jgi:hypothetical protein